jgi:hypothetical protein
LQATHLENGCARLEQAHVAGQDDPPVGRGTRRDLLVGRVTEIGRIEAEQPQMARELPEMPIGDEARLPERPRTQAARGRDVEPLEHRGSSAARPPRRRLIY